ncbi:G protein pathway suppressor 2 isoform X3 [Drosophila elegans]|uniref:G protein pathway suppressor 2 isoform X3 n=1 Tax=Drosophila elegans TaxID=30023 RepID=UPI0007E75D99|nr:G protein pathway suppressor 2 isoform X3 [Drosophila elegans]
MPPASAVNNSNAAAQAAKAERAEKLRGALKGFIVSDRQRRQEEFEAQCEEQRLRQEREEVERQNQEALEDTRGQITRLDEQLADLHSQKHQLTVQLKKVLNEDETRKKLAKENELFAIQQAAASGPVFLPPLRLQHQHHPLMQKPTAGGQPGKRGRSPSPPSQQQQAYYKSAASYAQQKTTAQYPGTNTVFYQTAPAPPTTSIYNYNLPLRQAYHVELPSATVSKPPDSQSPKAPSQGQPMQVLHINLDQPAISQADLVAQAGGSISGKSSQPQVTMEKLPDRYHIEVKHDGQPPSHVPPPPHLLSEGVIYSELSLHPNVLQISSSQFLPQNPKAAGSITQGYAPGRGGSAHEQQLARQQLAMLPGQPGAPSGSVSGSAQPPPGQQMHYTRRLY